MTSAQMLEATRFKMQLSKKRMAALLKISPEWYGKIVSGKKEVSNDVMLRHSVLLMGNLDLDSSPAGGNELKKPVLVHSPGAGKAELMDGPSTREDCEMYFLAIIQAASTSGNPNAFPVIHDRLTKQFPLSEWRNSAGASPPPPGSIVITPEDLAKMKDVVAKEHARALKQTITAAESRPPK